MGISSWQIGAESRFILSILFASKGIRITPLPKKINDILYLSTKLNGEDAVLK